MTITAIDIFNYIRGGVRGVWGIEDFQNKAVVIVGMNSTAQNLLSMFCHIVPEIYFRDDSISNYASAHKICRCVRAVSEGDEIYANVVIDLVENRLSIGRENHGFKTTNISHIGKDPYTQGIHDFYL